MENRAHKTEQRAPAGELLRLVGEILGSCGMGEDDAKLLADSLVEADLAGTHSHGVLRVPEYVKKLTRDGVNPRGQPHVLRDEGACLVVDGDNSMGQLGAHYAMQRAIERAETTGVAVATIRGSNHCGAMAYYARQALASEMIGMATTNALPTMAPWGGSERIVGINPVSYAIPAGEEQPIVYDAAFSGSSHGKLRIYKQKGLTLPEGWALDGEGRPTTDPAAAIEGLLMPIGGFKGVGLAMIMGILSSLLSGAAYGTELGDMEHGPRPGQDGHFCMALRISAFEELDRFKARVDGVIRQIHACRRAPGVEQVYVPGEIEAQRRAAYLREGIPLNRAELADLGATARERGVDTGPYRWLG